MLLELLTEEHAALQVVGISVQDVYTKDDFLVESYRDWGVSDHALRRLMDFMVGEPVGPAEFTQSELEAAGYTSWKQYEICAAIRAW